MPYFFMYRHRVVLLMPSSAAVFSRLPSLRRSAYAICNAF